MFYRFYVHLQDGVFQTFPTKPLGWTHVVLNYIGPNDGEEIRIYYDGKEVASDITKQEGPFSSGVGRIVVGRLHTDEDKSYASVQVDELIFFNSSLTLVEVKLLFN